jgi:hypothetical protein
MVITPLPELLLLPLLSVSDPPTALPAMPPATDTAPASTLVATVVGPASMTNTPPRPDKPTPTTTLTAPA